MNLRERATQLKRDIPVVYYALKDPETPLIAKIIAGITIAYALSPLDIIPDFIPVLGYLDDLILLPSLIVLTIKLIPTEVWEKNRALAEELESDPAQKRWYFALPIVVFWILIVVFCFQRLLGRVR